MDQQRLWTRITLWVNRAVAMVLAVLIFTLPSLLRWYAGFRFLSAGQQWWITGAFYCCVGIIGWALWQMDCLLRNILAGEVFVRKNIRAIRGVQWCCALICIVTGVTCFAYLPLETVAMIMGFLSLTICVVAQVMDAAVTIREESDLTI